MTSTTRKYVLFSKMCGKCLKFFVNRLFKKKTIIHFRCVGKIPKKERLCLIHI